MCCDSNVIAENDTNVVRYEKENAQKPLQYKAFGHCLFYSHSTETKQFCLCNFAFR